MNKAAAMRSLSEKIKAMYQFQDSLPKLIEDISIPDQKLDNYYVKLNMLVETTSEKIPIKLEEIFAVFRDQKEENRVLIVGGAGIGKSSFLQNIVYKWGKGSLFSDKFDFVFKVKLKKILSEDSTLQSENKKNRFAKLILMSIEEQQDELEYSRRQKGLTIDELDYEFSLEDISAALIENKTLVLLDGYDEIAHSLSEKYIIPLFNQINKLKNINVLMTSRPSGINFRVKSEFKRKIECTGLNKDGVIEYINGYFLMQNVVLNSYIDHFADEENTILKKMESSEDPVAKEIYCQLSNILGDKVESIVDSKDNIKATIDEHYQSSQHLIRTLLETNISLSEISMIPINIAMLCMICSDHSVTQKFSGDFNTGRLYQEALNWLSKRYLLKSNVANSIKDLSQNDINNVEELKILKYVAGESFQVDIHSIEGENIHNTASRVSNNRVHIKEVYKYGLLRASGGGAASSIDGDNLIKQRHSFVHLSFQEYLTAYYFKELLLSDDKYRATSEFIGLHRNEPKYLLTLKFLAGIVTADTSVQRDLLVQRFWESVTCNIDQVIELGLKSKVTLLMHLLSQAKLNNEIDSLIPNIQKIKDLIDVVVISDITDYQEALTTSGYVSDNIKEALREAFHLNNEWKINYLKTVRRNKQSIDLENNTDYILMLAKHNLDRIEQEETRFVTVSEEDKVKEQDRISFLRRIELEKVILIISKLISSGNIDAVEVVNTESVILNAIVDIQNLFIQNLLDLFLYPNWQIKKVVIKAIFDILEGFQGSTNKRIIFEEAKKIITVLKWHITDDNLNVQVYLLFQLLISITNYESVDVKKYINYAILNQYLTIHKHRKIVVGDQLILFKNFEFLNQDVVNELLIQCKHPNWIQRYHSYLLLHQIITQKPILIGDTHVVDNLLIGLKDIDELVRRAAAVAIGTMVVKRPELITSDIIYNVIHLLTNSYSEVRLAAAKAIGSILEKRPKLITADIVDNLYNILSDSDSIVSRVAADAILLILEKRPEITTDILYKLINMLSDSDSDVSHVAAQTIGTIAEKKPALITSDVIDTFNDMANNSNYVVRRGVAEAIGSIAQNKPEIITITIRDQLFNLLSDQNIYVKQVAAEAFVTIAEKRPELLHTDLIPTDIIDTLLINIFFDVRLYAAGVIRTIIQKLPESIVSDISSKLVNMTSDSISDNNISNRSEITTVLTVLLSEKRHVSIILTDSDSVVNRGVAETIGLKKPALITSDSIDQVINMMSNSNSDVRQVAVSAIVSIAKQRPELITSDIINQLINILNDRMSNLSKEAVAAITEKITELLTTDNIVALVNMLSNSNSDVRQAAVRAIVSIAEKRPELITTDIIGKIINILIVKNIHERHVAAKVIVSIAEKAPELIRSDNIVKLIDIFNDIKSDVRTKAAEAIGSIAAKRPDLIATDSVDKLINIMRDANYYQRQEAEAAIKIITEKRPELITTDIIVKIINMLSDCASNVRQAAVEAIGTAAEKRPHIITIDNIVKLIKMFNDSDSGVRREAVKAVRSIAAESRPELITTDIIHKIIEMFNDSNSGVRREAAEAVKSIAEMRPELMTIDIMDKLFNVLSDTSDLDIRSEVAKAIKSMAIRRPELITPDIMDKVLKVLRDIDSDVSREAAKAIQSIAEMRPNLITPDIVNNLFNVLSDSDSFVSREAAKAIQSIAEMRLDLITPDTMNNLFTVLSDSDSDVKGKAAETIGSIAEKRPELITTDIVDKLINLLSDSDSFVTMEAAAAIRSIAEMIPDFIPADIMDKLLKVLRDIDFIVKRVAAEAIGSIAEKRPDLITRAIMDELANVLSDSDSIVRWVTAEAIKSMAIRRPELITTDIVDKLINVLNDSDSDVSREAAKAIQSIAEMRPNLITLDTMDKLFKVLRDSNSFVRRGAAETIGSIAEMRPDLITPDIVDKFINVLSDSNSDVRQVALVAIESIAEKRPDLITPAIMDKLINRLSDENAEIRMDAVYAIGSIAGKIPDLLTPNIIDKIITMLNDDTDDVSRAANNVIEDVVVGQSPDLIATIIIGKLLNSLSINAHTNKRVCRSRAIVFITQVRPKLITTDNLDICINILSDSSPIIRSTAAEVINLMITMVADVITTNIVNKVISMLSNSDSVVKQVAVQAIGTIAKKRPDLITTGIIKLSVDMLRDNNYNVRIAAVGSIGSIAKKKSEIITTNIIDKLTNMLRDSDSDVRLAAALAIGSILEKSPELITNDIMLKFNNMTNNSNSDVRRRVAEAIGLILENSPDLINPDIIDKLIKMLCDSDSDLSVRAALRSEIITKEKSEIITANIIDKLTNMLSNSDSDVSHVAAQTIGTILDSRPEIITNDIIGKVINLLNDNDDNVSQSVKRILRLVAEKIPELITTDNLLMLINILSGDSNSDLSRTAAVKAITYIAEMSPDVITPDIVDNLNKMLSNSDTNVRLLVVENFGYIAERIPELITTDILNNLVNILSSDSYSNLSRGAAVKAIGTIAEKRSELITTDIITKLVSPSYCIDYDVLKVATVRIVGSIIEKRPTLITTDIIDKLINRLSDSDSILRRLAAEAIVSTAVKRPELITPDIVENFINRLSDSNFDVRGKATAKAIGSIAEKRSEIITINIISKIGGLLGDGREHVRESAEIILSSISVSISDISIRILDHSSKAARLFVEKIFTIILNNLEERCKVTTKKLLSIISFYDPKDPEKKSLLELTRRVLQDKVSRLTEGDISDITSDYEYLLTLSSESKSFMMKLLARTLRKSKITAVEKDFIIESLQYGIALSFIKDRSNNQIKIVFEGVTYFFEDNVSDEFGKGYIEEIVRAGLAQKNDILVTQYNNYTPLFGNSGKSLSLASSDRSEVTSMVTEENILSSDSWVVTLMHYASVTNEAKLDPDRIFILLERRNEFGEVQIEKFPNIKKVPSDTETGRQVIHPTCVNKELRALIFGPMEYSTFKPRYYGTSIIVSYEQGVELLSTIAKNRISMFSFDRSYEFIRGLLSESEILSPRDMAHHGLTLDWEKYIYHKYTSEWKKDVLLKSESDQARRDSFNVNTGLKLDSHIQQCEKEKKELDARLVGLSDELLAIRVEMTTFKSEIDAVTLKINALNTEGGKAFTEELKRKLESIDDLNEKIEKLQIMSKDSLTLSESLQILDTHKHELNRLLTDMARHQLEINRITVLSHDIQILKEKDSKNTELLSALTSQVELLMKTSEEMSKTKLELSQLTEAITHYELRISEIVENSDDNASSIKRLEMTLAVETIKKVDLLALQQRLELQESKLTKLLQSDVRDSSRIQYMFNEIAVNKNTVTSIRSQVEEHTRKLNHFKRIFKDATILESMICQEKLEIKDREELHGILSDPYQEAFYNALTWQLSATYLAATVVQTGIVTNSQTGTLSTIGGVVTTLAPYIPFIGLGAHLIGALLTYVDAALQSKMVANFAHIVTSSEEMSKLVDMIARQIVTSNLDIKNDHSFLSRLLSLFEHVKKTVNDGNDAVAQSILNQMLPTSTDDIPPSIQGKKNNWWDYAKRIAVSFRKSNKNKVTPIVQTEVEEKEEEEKDKKEKEEVEELQQLTEAELKIVKAREKGEEDAATVAQLLIARMYIGLPDDITGVEAIAEFLINLISVEFKSLGEANKIYTTDLDDGSSRVEATDILSTPMGASSSSSSSRVEESRLLVNQMNTSDLDDVSRAESTSILVNPIRTSSNSRNSSSSSSSSRDEESRPLESQMNTTDLDDDSGRAISTANLVNPIGTSNSSSTISSSEDNVAISKNISNAILSHIKVLLKVKNTSSDETDFDNALVTAFQTTYRRLLESTKKCLNLKTMVIEELVKEFTKTNKISLLFGQFLSIKKESRDNYDAFLKPVFTKVLKTLGNTCYQDDISNVILQLQ